eukprot:scaffold1535_cov382-Prasinococcus_capsulatus_cf.AAC.44
MLARRKSSATLMSRNAPFLPTMGTPPGAGDAVYWLQVGLRSALPATGGGKEGRSSSLRMGVCGTAYGGTWSKRSLLGPGDAGTEVAKAGSRVAAVRGAHSDRSTLRCGRCKACVFVTVAAAGDHQHAKAVQVTCCVVQDERLGPAQRNVHDHALACRLGLLFVVGGYQDADTLDDGTSCNAVSVTVDAGGDVGAMAIAVRCIAVPVDKVEDAIALRALVVHSAQRQPTHDSNMRQATISKRMCWAHFPLQSHSRNSVDC